MTEDQRRMYREVIVRILENNPLDVVERLGELAAKDRPEEEQKAIADMVEYVNETLERYQDEECWRQQKSGNTVWPPYLLGRDYSKEV